MFLDPKCEMFYLEAIGFWVRGWERDVENRGWSEKRDIRLRDRKRMGMPNCR